VLWSDVLWSDVLWAGEPLPDEALPDEPWPDEPYARSGDRTPRPIQMTIGMNVPDHDDVELQAVVTDDGDLLVPSSVIRDWALKPGQRISVTASPRLSGL